MLRVVLTWSCLTAVCLLCQDVADAQHVHTNRPRGKTLLPLPKARDVWHFAVFGDRTGGRPEGIEVLRQAVADTNLLDPDLVMTVGDLVQGYNTTESWLEQTREFKESMDKLRMPWFPVAGNHDIYWRGANRPEGEHETNYERHFGPLWYWFPHKDAAFVVLYTDEGDANTGKKDFTRRGYDDMTAEQLAWLRKTLEETKSYRHVFVFLHHPRWRKNYHGNWNEVHSELERPGNVKAVFAGHIHRARYSGSKDGIEYFVLATTGGAKSHEAPRAGWLHHFDVVTVRNDGIQVAAVPVGQVVDPRSLTDDALAEIDRLMGDKSVVRSTSRLAISADGGVESKLAVELKNPSQHPIELTVEFTAGMDGWMVQPDHMHARLAPGQKRTFEMACRRGGEPWSGPVPRLAYQVDVLTSTQRISLPERHRSISFDLTSVADSFWLPRNRALRLDGENSCVAVRSKVASPPQGAFTLEGWVRGNDFRGRRPFLAKSENSEYYIFVTDGVPTFGVHLGGKYIEAAAGKLILQTKRWYHIAGVFDGSEVRLYVDGRAVAVAEAPGKRKLNKLPLFIGADPNGNGNPVNHLNGWIDEVRLSTGARYRADFEPRSRSKPDAATLLLFHFDHDLGPFALDHSGSAAHSVRMGNAQSSTRPK